MSLNTHTFLRLISNKNFVEGGFYKITGIIGHALNSNIIVCLLTENLKTMSPI